MDKNTYWFIEGRSHDYRRFRSEAEAVAQALADIKGWPGAVRYVYRAVRPGGEITGVGAVRCVRVQGEPQNQVKIAGQWCPAPEAFVASDPRKGNHA